MFTQIDIYINRTGEKNPNRNLSHSVSIITEYFALYILYTFTYRVRSDRLCTFQFSIDAINIRSVFVNIGNFYLVIYKISHKITLIQERPDVKLTQINCQIAIEAFLTVPKSKNELNRKGKGKSRTRKRCSSSGIVWNKNIRPILCNKRCATFETPRDTCLLVCTIIPWLAR